MQKHKITNYSQINEFIFLGSNFCCRTHFSQELLSKGITTDISLEDERIDAPAGVKAYLWLPVKDHFAPTKYQFYLGIQTIDYALKNRQKVYIHCMNGHGRGPTLTIAYFIYKGMKPKEAHDFVKEKRPEVHLEEDQLEALQDFYQTLKW